MVDQPPFRREAVANPVYISWGAVIAGAIAASALTFVLITFGAAIGLGAALHLAQALELVRKNAGKNFGATQIDPEQILLFWTGFWHRWRAGLHLFPANAPFKNIDVPGRSTA